jgi:hypothetical protein
VLAPTGEPTEVVRFDGIPQTLVDLPVAQTDTPAIAKTPVDQGFPYAF